MKSDKELLVELIEQFPENIKPVESFPKSYPEIVFPEKIKAIYLGCDPTNKHLDDLAYVFALVDTPQVFKGFVTTHTNQLKALGLTWDDVYVQNLCRNHFFKETSKNLRVWKKAAVGYWIDNLKDELNDLKIPESIPVLLTSKYLFDVLVSDKTLKKKSAREFYLGKETIPVPASKNLLGRPLIPLYRGRSPKKPKLSYYLKNNDKLSSYTQKVKSVLNKS